MGKLKYANELRKMARAPTSHIVAKYQKQYHRPNKRAKWETELRARGFSSADLKKALQDTSARSTGSRWMLG